MSGQGTVFSAAKSARAFDSGMSLMAAATALRPLAVVLLRLMGLLFLFFLFYAA